MRDATIDTNKSATAITHPMITTVPLLKEVNESNTINKPESRAVMPGSETNLIAKGNFPTGKPPVNKSTNPSIGTTQPISETLPSPKIQRFADLQSE